ncbi:MAG TPA: outer-membrane lipoprotein carrier protein LolA [Candidatus Angelobacter sp.]|nr:outer-membrane lipoprotein carrier protein LolA [Candidatus Angelobacter sp.]
MKFILATVVALLISAPCFAASVPRAADDLESVLAQMDKAAPGFKSVQADCQWEEYHKAFDVKSFQQGQFYSRRNGNNLEAAIKIVAPAPRQIVFKDGKVRIYEPRMDQERVEDLGNNQSALESYLSLGFGGSGSDLAKSYDIRLSGWETVDSVKTAMLELVAKSSKVRDTFTKIVVWIDLQRDVALKQQLFEPSGDYRLIHYTNLKVNGRLPDTAFKIQKVSQGKDKGKR